MGAEKKICDNETQRGEKKKVTTKDKNKEREKISAKQTPIRDLFPSDNRTEIQLLIVTL